MIRRCTPDDFERILAIINDAATAYRGIIPEDRWKEPYMPPDELSEEIAAGIDFDGYEIDGTGLVGVMGFQLVADVTLIRHAYVATDRQRSGIGSALLEGLRRRTDRPVLIGTWSAADWAIAFYRQRGFEVVPAREKTALLRRYWTVPERQIETSVVLADHRWRTRTMDEPAGG